jgi:hypothetical protein
MTDPQLPFFDLLGKAPAEDPRRSSGPARGVDGAGRLLRQLARNGLDPDALPQAAAIALLLDAEAGARR